MTTSSNEDQHPSYYGTLDQLHYITELCMALDGNVTYGDLWDSNEDNKVAFDEAKAILDEYAYGVTNGLIGSAR
jgi:hypothetical protein